MKALSSLVLVLAMCAAMVTPSNAAADKQLVNVRGTVYAQTVGGIKTPVAVNVNVTLNDSDSAVTGANSQGKIILPDSSNILVGQNTQVQLSEFNAVPNLATAKFVVVQGKVRFQVEHPNGAKANYTFQTTTGQIAVRGTEGDIAVDSTQLQVNVYDLTDPNLPVEVDLTNGQKYFLHAGEALTVGIAGAAIASAAVSSSITQPMQDEFSEFGPPKSHHEAGKTGVNGTTAAILGAAAVGLAIGLSGHGGTSGGSQPINSPSPTPTPHHTPPPSPTPSPTTSPSTKPSTSPTPSITPSISPTPSPTPTTTCVPIIIHLVTAGHKPAPAATATPCSAGPGVPNVHPVPTEHPPAPRPVGPPPPAPKPSAAPKQTPGPKAPPKPPNAPQGPPGMPGMQTPPPMPGLPPSRKRTVVAFKAEAVAMIAIKRARRR